MEARNINERIEALRKGEETHIGGVSVKVRTLSAWRYGPELKICELGTGNGSVPLSAVEIRRAIELLELAHEAMTGKKP